MIKTNKPVGLIRYTSESALEGKPTKLVRPRTVLYTFLLTIVVSAFAYNVAYRADLELDIHRSVKKGEPLFSTLGEDKIMNRLRFRVQNRTTAKIDFHVTVAEPAGAEVKLIGQQDFWVKAGETKRVEAFVIVPADAFLAGSAKGVFKLESPDDDLTLTQEFMLLGPSTRKKK